MGHALVCRRAAAQVQQALVVAGPRAPAPCFLHARLHSLPFGPENHVAHPAIGAVGALHIGKLVRGRNGGWAAEAFGAARPPALPDHARAPQRRARTPVVHKPARAPCPAPPRPQVLVAGTVVRVGPVKMAACQQVYACGRCGHQFPAQCRLEDGGAAVLPEACPRPGRQCGGAKFVEVPHAAAFTGFQEIKVGGRGGTRARGRAGARAGGRLRAACKGRRLQGPAPGARQAEGGCRSSALARVRLWAVCCCPAARRAPCCTMLAALLSSPPMH